MSIFYCKPRGKDPETSFSRDSVLSQYLSILDSLKEYRPNGDVYSLLKAYVINDSNYLRNFKEKLQYTLNERLRRTIADSCVNEPLTKSNLDEEYYFRIDNSWSSEKIGMCVSKKDTNYKLSFFMWHPAFDTAHCKILVEHHKDLTEDDWSNIVGLIRKTDFWALQADGPTIIDANYLTVSGYKTTNIFPGGINHVVTRVAGYTSLSDVFDYVYKLSDYKINKSKQQIRTIY